jgi:hypothetical protein
MAWGRRFTMKGFQKTLLILVCAALCTQLVRHVHVYVIGYEESILAPAGAYYEFKEQVRMEESTDDLMAEYEALEEELDQLKKADPSKEQHILMQENAELFALHSALASELRERQTVTREIRDTWIFSGAGLVLIVLGVFIYSRGSGWVGMSLLVPGFLELMWWSAPSFTLGGAIREYDTLLVNKIILTIVALALAYALWFFAQRMRAAGRSVEV